MVGNELHTPDEYNAAVEAKFPDGWHDRLAEEFDKYLADLEPAELTEGNRLFDLYKAWRDGCKVGLNRVDWDRLLKWLREHESATRT